MASTHPPRREHAISNHKGNKPKKEQKAFKSAIGHIGIIHFSIKRATISESPVPANMV
jgi:hypothetical protein